MNLPISEQINALSAEPKCLDYPLHAAHLAVRWRVTGLRLAAEEDKALGLVAWPLPA